MRGLIRNIAGLTFVSAMAVSGAASAELFGLLNGRSADLSRAPDRSFEAGATLAEVDDADVEHFGGRFNYKFNPTTVLYGDVGQSNVEDFDGLTFGLGGYWQMDGVFAGSDFAVHASYHRVDLDFDDSDVNLEGNTIVVEGLFSSLEPINQAGNMYFNGSIGFSRRTFKQTLGSQSSDSDTDTELTFSAGVVAETQNKTGELYAGVLYVDDLGFGAGYRHFLK